MAYVIPGPPPLTTPAERAQVYFANALLPATLPTPPRSKMMPLLPTPCLVILPMPSRADADERWDARKNAVKVKVASSVPGRADGVVRWDAQKVKPALSTSASSSSSASSRASSSSQKWNSNKKRATSHAASAERWNAHKEKQQPQPLPARELDDDDGSSTGSNDMGLGTPPQEAYYAGSGFIVAPEPGMLPMPSFMVRVA